MKRVLFSEVEVGQEFTQNGRNWCKIQETTGFIKNFGFKWNCFNVDPFIDRVNMVYLMPDAEVFVEEPISLQLKPSEAQTLNDILYQFKESSHMLRQTKGLEQKKLLIEKLMGQLKTLSITVNKE